MRLLFLTPVLALGCSLVFDPSSLAGRDAGSDVSAIDAPQKEASVDAGEKKCALEAPFTKIAPLSGFDGPSKDFRPTLSKDELEIFFGSDRDGKFAIFHATRGRRDDVFGTQTRVTSLDMQGYDVADPSITPDGLTLYFIRHLNTASWDLYSATRATTGDPFGNAKVLSALNTSNNDEIAPFTYANELYFTSSTNGYDIYVSRSGGAAVPVSELNSMSEEDSGCISQDGLAVYLSSSRGTNGQDIYLATRATLTSPFVVQGIVTELTSPKGERCGFLSADRCRLYFESDRAGNDNIYVAERTP